MDTFQYILIPITMILGLLSLALYTQLTDRDNTIRKNRSWMSKAKDKIGQQKSIINIYKDREQVFSKWLSKEDIMARKGWSDTQFATMMWALRKEGLAKARGNNHNREYSILIKKYK